MAAGSSSAADRREEWRKLVTIGEVPEDFLRITSTEEQLQQENDEQTALALQQQYVRSSSTPGLCYQQNMARLSITIVQAKLKKNYGMTRMDPYVRLRVGHFIYETETHANGGKVPMWNKTIQCYLPKGVTSIYLEIFDECTFTIDEKIAWAHIPIPQNVFKGQTVDDWYPLSGRLGDGLEGVVNLVLTCSIGFNYSTMNTIPQSPPVMFLPSTTGTLKPTVVYQQSTPIPVQQVVVLSPDDFRQIEEMFPNIDKETILSIAETNGNNKERIINALLQMSE